MTKTDKWQMNRAGLLNFWYYDNEIFDFADGKLLLRGGNGSGKSVTMQSILPVLLDGRTSSDRLDPFGSRARRMEDYLLGEKEIVNRDERTGYLFLEYKREATSQYITTGIGLQARRHKQMNFWGFIITDNRRIGEDFFLYETEQHAGEKEQIPLSRVQLENRIGTGGRVVRTRGEYAELVNKHIFGFETIEAYEDLIKLLIQLRSPKLSKDFKPTVIYEILEAALPPLTDEDLRHLSDTIEHMDQTKQQIEQLEREQEAIDKIVKRYHAYNEYRLADTASRYLEAQRKYVQAEKITNDKVALQQTTAMEISELETRELQLTQTSDVLEQKQKRLQTHEVWRLEKEKQDEQNRLKEMNAAYAKKDQAVQEKMRQERSIADEMDKLENTIATIDRDLREQLQELETDAAEASFEQHTLNAQDFERKKQADFDFTVWKKEADDHYVRLEQTAERLRKYEEAKTEITKLDKQMADVQLEIDQTKQEEKDWLAIFEKDKQEKLRDIYQWAEENIFLQVNEEQLQRAAREIVALYEPKSFESVRAPFVEATQTYQFRVNETVATKESERKAVEKEISEQEMLLAEWQAKRDPEPDTRHPETIAAREKLTADNIAFIPFYEAVEFQPHVSEEERKRLEAALIDAGLLDALITEENIAITHDRIMQAQPEMMAHTLADYMMPDVDEETKVSAHVIDDVLRTILVDRETGANATVVQVDGTYSIGSLTGHAVPVDNVRFIGRSARKRYREEQIARISREIVSLQQLGRELLTEIDSLRAKIDASQQALTKFPSDEDLQTSFKEIKDKRFRVEQLQTKLLDYDRDMTKIVQVFHTLKRELDTETRDMNVTFSYEAYQEARRLFRHYSNTLGNFETLHVTYRHEQKTLAQRDMRLKELQEEVDELKGELNSLADKQARTEKNIKAMEEQLKAHGMDDIRKQIQKVQQEIEDTSNELKHMQKVLPEKRAAQNVLQDEIRQQRQRLRFAEKMITAWETTFTEEINYRFLSVPEEVEGKSEIAKWAVKEYRSLLRETDIAKLDGNLTNIFYAELGNMMEYRMTDVKTEAPLLSFEEEQWTDDQVVLLVDWKNNASRRLIQLDFQGKRLSPYYIQDIITTDRERQQTLLNDQDRQLYEEILFDSVGKKLRSRIYRAQQWTEKMNELMMKSDSTSGISFSIRWKPRTAETEAELDTKELVDLLRRDPRLLKEEDLNQVMEHFRSKIERAKELIEIKGAGSTLLQVLKEVLDYRHWFSFILSYQRVDEPRRELTNNAFYKFSGGEKAMAMYIPLFTASYSRYLEADPSAPYIITLDEAFAGVDDDNISVMFRIVEELGFDYMMNSQVLWGDYDTVSSLSICELVRPKNADFVTVIRYMWDGKTRHLVVDEAEEEEVTVE